MNLLHEITHAMCGFLFFKAAQAPGSGDDRPILRDHGIFRELGRWDLEAAGAARSW